MIVLNLAERPLNPEQIDQIEALTNQRVEQVINASVSSEPAETIASLVQKIVLAKETVSNERWSDKTVAVNLTGNAKIDIISIVSLWGKLNQLPQIIQLKPRPFDNPPQYDVTGVLDLDTLKETVRGVVAPRKN